MLNLPQAGEDLPQAGGIEDQGIATGEQDIRDLRVSPDVGKPPRDILIHLAGVVDEEAFAETVSAEPTAVIAHQQQSRLPVLMLQPRRPGIQVLRRWVQAPPGLKLLQGRYDQPPDRVLRVIPVYQ